MRFGLMQYSNTILFLIVILLVIIYPFYLIIKALRKYGESIRSQNPFINRRLLMRRTLEKY